MKFFLDYQKYKNYEDNFLYNIFNINNILIIYIYIYITIYFISFHTIELNEL